MINLTLEEILQAVDGSLYNGEMTDLSIDNVSIDSRTIKENSIGLGAMVTFIGLYLGIIFLISCAAILALKELSESSDRRL